jgi:hypothetical protein
VALDEAYEADISQRVERFRGVGALAIAQGDLESLREPIDEHLARLPRPSTVVVQMAGLRPHVQELVRTRWSDVPVLAAHELLDQWWDPAATVELRNLPRGADAKQRT